MESENMQGSTGLYLMYEKKSDGEFAIKKAWVKPVESNTFDEFINDCCRMFGGDEKIPDWSISEYCFADKESIPSDITVRMQQNDISEETAQRLDNPDRQIDLQFAVFQKDYIGDKNIADMCSLQGVIKSSLNYEEWEVANEDGLREKFREDNMQEREAYKKAKEQDLAKSSGAGFVFIEYTDYDTPKVADIQIYSKTEKSFESYMHDRYWKYFGEKSLPENVLAVRETEDISRLPARGEETPTEYYENNSALLNAESKEIDKRKLLEAAYCIENSVTFDSFNALPIGLYLDPEYRLYQVINDKSYRLLYHEFSNEQKDTLLNMINEDKPSMHLTGIPAIGNEPAYRPQWAQDKFGRKEEHDYNFTIEDLRKDLADSEKAQKSETSQKERQVPAKRQSPPAVDRRTPTPSKKKNGHGL